MFAGDGKGEAVFSKRYCTYGQGWFDVCSPVGGGGFDGE
jgi:hypothetical protein